MPTIIYVFVAFVVAAFVALAVIAYKASKLPVACGVRKQSSYYPDEDFGSNRMIGGVDVTDLSGPDLR